MPFSFDGKSGHFDDCMKHQMGKTNSRTGKKFTKDEASSVCATIMRKQEGERLLWTSDVIFENVDIQLAEGYGTKGKKIRGTLVHATESRNGRIYEYDGVIKAGQLAELPMPISMNHTEDVTDNVALITKLIPTSEGLDYEGVAFNTSKHSGTLEMLENKLINKISIEADKPLIERKNDKVIVKEFQLLGAGFVKYAGIPQASASLAEALEHIKTEEVAEVEEIEKLKNELAESKKQLESLKTAETEKRNEEAKRLQEAKDKELVEIKDKLMALQEEMKKLKENKPTGIITENAQPVKSYKIAESVAKAGFNKNTFVFENKGTPKAQFFPMRPEEFY